MVIERIILNWKLMYMLIINVIFYDSWMKMILTREKAMVIIFMTFKKSPFV